MKLKGFWLRTIPVVVLVVATIAMAVGVYFDMVQSEEELCWQRLEIATNSTTGKINTRITDNINFLSSVADAYTLTHNLDNPQAVGRHLSSVVDRTIFDRIDVILPDNSMITQGGERLPRNGKSTYQELVDRGTHVTQRLTSSFSGEEAICCVTPIEQDGDILGLLVGTIHCNTLSNLFHVATYGEAAQLFMIDQRDGQYLMDTWHDYLGNVQQLGRRQSAYSDEIIDMTHALISGQQARFAFISQTNGARSYQYSAPVEGYNWTVCVLVQEDVVFANVKQIQKSLLEAGAIGLAVILVYLLWNVFLNLRAAQSEEKVRRLEYERAKNAARATFISNMSHDIRTPLNGIVGMLQIIQNHRSDEDLVDDCLNKIEVSAQYLSTLTNDMLDINEIENNKLVLPQEPVDLCKLASDLCSLMEKQAHDTGVSLAVDHSGLTHPRIIGSSVHIKRILVNLIGNAIKYSKNAGRNVWVTLTDEPLDGDRQMVRFVIRDNGIGMSETFQQNMYKAFEQESIGPRSEYQGYGLGLTIVHQLVKKMGGTIELASEKGVGSTFTVSIPFRLDTQPSTSQAAPAADLSGLRLLLAEDNEFNREIATTLLNDAGAQVDAVIDGQQALEAFAASEPGTYDAIIMDVMMPVMDGCQATRAIRALKRPDAVSVPIIAMTASTFAEDVERCLAAGMNAHMAKPFRMESVVATLKTFHEQNHPVDP